MRSAEVDDTSPPPSEAGSVATTVLRSMPLPPIGSTVKIHSLKSRPELNGCSVIVDSLNERTVRVNVKLESGEILALKPTALTLITSEHKPLPEADADDRAISVKASAHEWYKDAREAVTLKLTLNSKQLKKSLSAAVVAPFLKAFSKKIGSLRDEDLEARKIFELGDVASASVDGVVLSDLSIPAGVVLMPRKVVSLELALKLPPPPPPLLTKNVALTRLDSTAYRAEHNGMWGRATGFDEARNLYSVAVGGKRTETIWVRPEQLIDISARKMRYDWSQREFADDVAPHRKIPNPGTIAHDIYLRNVERYAQQDEKNRVAALARKAYAAVPLLEKLSHVDTHLSKQLGALRVARSFLAEDLQLKKGNGRLNAGVKDSEDARTAIEGLFERLDVAAEEANAVDAASAAAPAEGAEAAAQGTTEAAALGAAPPPPPPPPVDVTDAALPPAAAPPKSSSPTTTMSERVAALRAEVAAGVSLAQETSSNKAAIKYHCSHRTGEVAASDALGTTTVRTTADGETREEGGESALHLRKEQVEVQARCRSYN